MDTSPQQDASASQDVVIERTEDMAAEQGWVDVQKEVARVVPRLREIATQALLLGPIIGATSDFWGGGGSGRGC